MDCGAGDFACYIDADHLKSLQVVPLLRELAQFLTFIFNAAVEALKPHLNALVALASLSFAIWKWYRYRDAALFDRLKELIAKTVTGLRVDRADLLEAICRPAPGQTPKAPLFIESDLRRVLLKRSWSQVLRSRTRLTRTERRLDSVLEEIDKQLSWTEMRLALFREQRATVHVIKGAIASARSQRAKTEQSWWNGNNDALAHFRDALGVPGNKKDLGAMEYKAHQLRKLGHLEGALTCYEELEVVARLLEASKARGVIVARAMRYQAEICRLQQSLRNANGLFSAALQELAPYAPLTGRDLLDQAEMNELQGCVRFGLNFNNAASVSLSAAIADYQRLVSAFEEEDRHILSRTLRRLRTMLRNDKRAELRKAAQDGLARTTRALQDGTCRV
jgi:hypothetical protein